jgi:hypothetical protein
VLRSLPSKWPTCHNIYTRDRTLLLYKIGLNTTHYVDANTCFISQFFSAMNIMHLRHMLYLCYIYITCHLWSCRIGDSAGEEWYDNLFRSSTMNAMKGWSTRNSSGGGGRAATRATPVMTAKWKTHINAFSFYHHEENAVLLWDNTRYTMYRIPVYHEAACKSVHTYAQVFRKTEMSLHNVFFIQTDTCVFSQTKLNRQGESCINCNSGTYEGSA